MLFGVCSLPTALDLLRRWTLSASMAAALRQRSLLPHEVYTKKIAIFFKNRASN